MLKGRTKLDIKKLKCLVFDEADVFFLEDKNFACIKSITGNEQIKSRPADDKVQLILFSATYPAGAESQ